MNTVTSEPAGIRPSELFQVRNNQLVDATLRSPDLQRARQILGDKVKSVVVSRLSNFPETGQDELIERTGSAGLKIPTARAMEVHDALLGRNVPPDRIAEETVHIDDSTKTISRLNVNVFAEASPMIYAFSKRHAKTLQWLLASSQLSPQQISDVRSGYNVGSLAVNVRFITSDTNGKRIASGVVDHADSKRLGDQYEEILVRSLRPSSHTPSLMSVSDEMVTAQIDPYAVDKIGQEMNIAVLITEKDIEYYRRYPGSIPDSLLTVPDLLVASIITDEPFLVERIQDFYNTNNG